MNESFLVKIIEHNNWANLKTIDACYALTDEQFDAEPQTVTKGSIRKTLIHLVKSQRGYLALLTVPVDARPDSDLAFSVLKESARISGEGLLALARNEADCPLSIRLQTKDGYWVDPQVVMVQVINHATEHREQIKSIMSSLGLTPPDIDGWDFGEATDSLIPMSK